MPPPRRRANTTKFAVGFLAGLVIVGLTNLNLIGEVAIKAATAVDRVGRRVLGGSIGRVAAGSVVLVHPDRSRDVTVYRQAAHEICARAVHCHVVFWIDERPMNELKGMITRQQITIQRHKQFRAVSLGLSNIQPQMGGLPAPIH